MKAPKKKVILVGLTFSGLCAYGLWHLKAYARKYGSIRNNYDINILEFGAGENSRKIVKEVFKRRPDILGFTVHHGLEAKVADISDGMKRKMKDLLIIWGGTEVSNNSESVLKRNSFVDVITRGEGEVTFAEILKRHLLRPFDFADIEGIARRCGKETTCNPDRRPETELANFPSPYLSGILDPKKYEVVHVETYRGCPFKCGYCYEYRGFKDVRFFPIARIRKELPFLLRSGVHSIKFFDTTFTWKKKRVMEILRILAENNKNTIISAETVGELLDEDIIRRMKRAGFLSLEIGIQTVNGKTLRNIGRPWHRKKFEENVKCLIKYNINPLVHVMGGLPGDNLADTKETINYVFSLGATPHLFLTRILGGTRFEKEAGHFGIKFLHHGLRDIVSNSTYSAEEVTRYTNIMAAHAYCRDIINGIPTLARELRMEPADFYEKFSVRLRTPGLNDRPLLPLREISEFLRREHNNIGRDKRGMLMEFLRYCAHEFKARNLRWDGPEREKASGATYESLKFEHDFSGLEMFHPRLVNLRDIRDVKTVIVFIREKRDIKKIAVYTGKSQREKLKTRIRV